MQKAKEKLILKHLLKNGIIQQMGRFNFNITTELLSAYAKNWEKVKVSNIKASQEMIADNITVLNKTQEIFQPLRKSSLVS